jgi:hypothetical protein
VVESLSSKCEALDSIPSTITEKKKKKKKHLGWMGTVLSPSEGELAP